MTKKKGGSFAKKLLPPLIAGVILFGGWELAVRLFHISELVLPAPSKIVSYTIEWFPIDIYPQFWMTFKVAAIGMVISTVIGIILATFISQSRFVIKMTTPLVVFLMTMPMMVMAPVLMLAMQESGAAFPSRLVVVILQTTPVVMLNTMHGFQKTTKDNMELARVYGMKSWDTIRKITFPSALPEVFVGAKLGCIVSLLCTIGCEFALGNIGLGFWIQHCLHILATPTAFGSIFMVALIGLFMQLCVGVIEKLTIRYQ